MYTPPTSLPRPPTTRRPTAPSPSHHNNHNMRSNNTTATTSTAKPRRESGRDREQHYHHPAPVPVPHRRDPSPPSAIDFMFSMSPDSHFYPPPPKNQQPVSVFARARQLQALQTRRSAQQHHPSPVQPLYTFPKPSVLHANMERPTSASRRVPKAGAGHRHEWDIAEEDEEDDIFCYDDEEVWHEAPDAPMPMEILTMTPHSSSAVRRPTVPNTLLVPVDNIRFDDRSSAAKPKHYQSQHSKQQQQLQFYQDFQHQLHANLNCDDQGRPQHFKKQVGRPAHPLMGRDPAYARLVVDHKSPSLRPKYPSANAAQANPLKTRSEPIKIVGFNGLVDNGDDDDGSEAERARRKKRG